MKRLLFFLLVIIIFLTAFVYIFIPENIVISKVWIFKCTPNVISRHLSDQGEWEKWFPVNRSNIDSDSSISKKNNLFSYNGDSYFIIKKNNNAVALEIKNKSGVFNSNMYALQLPDNNAALQWQCNINGGLNPLQRINKYIEARKLKNNMSDVLDSFNFFLSKKENAYGMNIELSSTRDTILTALKASSPLYPTTTNIYDLISKLKKYITQQKGIVTGYPMLNVTSVNNHFEIMVAIPVNKALPNKEGFEQKRLIPGNFMTAQITGGIYTVNEALKQMEIYFEDNSKLAIAIPFQLLITDRINESDTNKWITKIYAPVVR